MKEHRCISFTVSVALIVSLISFSLAGHACTGIFLKAEDGNYVFARTLEHDINQLQFGLIFVPRNHNFAGQTPTGKPGMPWKSTYAYVGFNLAGTSIVGDGLKEKGLACGAFMFPGSAQYEKVTEDDYSRTISCIDLPSWILSTCASVSEVREQLPKILVCTIQMFKSDYFWQVHYMAADETGDAIIIEYSDGKLNIYDNEVNVITNSPAYGWELTNLRNYIGLKALNDPAITFAGKEFSQIGRGSGAIGLPGDFTPPSRFARAAFLTKTAYPGKNTDESIGIAFHILNQFDIPRGSVRDVDGGKIVDDETQWTSASDLTNRRYFYHTYSDRSVRMLDLKDLDLNAPDIKMIKDAQKPGEIENVSSQLK